MKTIASIADLRELARRKVPRAFFDYADSGSYQEETLRANRTDLEGIKLRQRILVDVSSRSLATTIVGQKVAAPFVLAPIGLCGMQHGNGEILSAQAANEAGIPFTLSTMSICSIEDVAEATHKPFWFQLYVIRDRSFSKDILGRAASGATLAEGDYLIDRRIARGRTDARRPRAVAARRRHTCRSDGRRRPSRCTRRPVAVPARAARRARRRGRTKRRRRRRHRRARPPG